MIGSMIPAPNVGPRLTALEDTYVNEYWAEISSGTTGTITPPEGVTIRLDQWPDDIDAVVSTVDTGNVPDGQLAYTAGGAVITTTLNTAGAYTLSGTPSAYPVAIIYSGGGNPASLTGVNVLGNPRLVRDYALPGANSDITSLTGLTTPLSVDQGGTGQNTVQEAIDTLSAVSGATNEHVLTKDTATGNAIFKSAAGADWEERIDGEAFTGVLAYKLITDQLDGKAINEVRISLLSLPTGQDFKVDIRKNGTASTDSIFTSDVPIEIGTAQSATNGVYMTACDVSGSLVGSAGTSLDSLRVGLAADNVLFLVVTQAGSTFAGSDFKLNMSIV